MHWGFEAGINGVVGSDKLRSVLNSDGIFGD
jgi:hypothetical protein